jgi:hypothetical protein
MKKHNSIALIAFTVFHDDEDLPTEEELRAGLVRRMSLLDSEGPEGYTEAVGGDITDTVLTDPKDFEDGLYE